MTGNLKIQLKENFLFGLVMTCRLLLGFVFLFSGTMKAIDPAGGAIKVEEYFTAFGFPDMQWLALPFSINLATVEFTLGVCMILGVYRKYSSLFALLMMLFMTPLTLYLALKNPVADCGCFGEAIILTNWQTFYKNIVLLAASIVAFLYHKRTTAFYSYKVYWFVAVYAYLFCIGFSIYNYRHLPIIDFRPFKVGTNIAEGMAIPDDALQDEYTYSFVYEKDGKEQTFTLDDAPSADSTWTFVRSESKLVSKGFQPLISDFVVLSFDGEDMTESLLNDTTGLFLLISPKLEEASDGHIDEINTTFDYAQEKKMRFYCLTGSEEAEIKQWVDYTGAEYPFLFCDAVTLKTMIRSNPGLMLLKEGTILAKWHNNDIPEEQQIDKITTNLLLKPIEDKKGRRILTNVLTFAVPLSLVWLFDFWRTRKKKGKTQEE